MNTKHTPGPWSVSNRDDWEAHISMNEPRFKLSGSWESAAVVYGIEDCGDVGAEVCKANACLIAAAPELYYALRMIVSALPKNLDWLDPDVERLAKHAIAKATGETP